jgi:hypothetical protein
MDAVIAPGSNVKNGHVGCNWGLCRHVPLCLTGHSHNGELICAVCKYVTCQGVTGWLKWGAVVAIFWKEIVKSEGVHIYSDGYFYD